MKQPIIALFIASIFFISFSVSAYAETTVYDDFSGPELDLSKWFISEKSNPNVQGPPDEYWIDTIIHNYHTQQYSEKEVELIMTAAREFYPGERVEYDVTKNSGSGNHLSMMFIDYDGYKYPDDRPGYVFGYWNGDKGAGNYEGNYHITLEFFDDYAVLDVSGPNGTSTHQIINDISIPYEFSFVSRTGHNGMFHIDYDNFVITTKEITGEYEVDNNTVALWHFNEGNGTIAYDETGVNHGTISGAVWDMNCFYGKCLNFDGEDDYIAVPDDDSLTFYEGNFTIEAWFKLSEPHQDYNLNFVGCPNYDNSCKWIIIKNGEYGLVLYHDGYLKFYIASGHGIPATYKSSTKNYWEANRWYHVAGVFENGNKWKIYIDGELDTEGNQTYYPMVTERQLTIGAMHDPALGSDLGYVNGTIDEVRISNIARDFEAKEEPSDLEERVAALEEKVGELEDRMTLAEAAITAIYDILNGMTGGLFDQIIGFLSHAPNGIKKQMVCGYMENEGLIEYSALGLDCEIKANGNCFCK